MTEQKNKNVNWANLVLGIIYIIVAIIAFKDPTVSLYSIAILLGISVILSGIGEITISRTINRYYVDDNYSLRMISGIVQIILGIVILVDINTTFIALPYIFAIWFIFTSVMGIILSSPLRLIANGVWTTLLILNILGIILGVMMISNPLSGYVTIVMLVGLYFLILGIRTIIHSF